MTCRWCNQHIFKVQGRAGIFWVTTSGEAICKASPSYRNEPLI